MDSILASAKPVIHIVRLANQICVQGKIGHSGDCSDGEITPDMLSNLGLTAKDISEIQEQLTGAMERAGAFLSAYR
jgi:hypothetical protein